MSIADFKLNSLTKALKTSEIEEYKSFSVVCKNKLDDFISISNDVFSITEINRKNLIERTTTIDISQIPFISDFDYIIKNKKFKTFDFSFSNLSQAILNKDITHSTLCTFNLKTSCDINKEIIESLTDTQLSLVAQKIKNKLNFYKESHESIFSKNKKEEFNESFYYCLKIKDASNRSSSIYSRTLDFKNDTVFKKGLMMMLENTEITVDEFLIAPKDSISTLRLLDY